MIVHRYHKKKLSPFALDWQSIVVDMYRNVYQVRLFSVDTHLRRYSFKHEALQPHFRYKVRHHYFEKKPFVKSIPVGYQFSLFD